jgi:hypothetical protein
MRGRQRTCVGVALSALSITVLSGLVVNDARAQERNSNRDITTSSESQEAIREHIDTIDDVIDDLLNWRHVTTSTGRGSLPTAPESTLISVPRAQLDRVGMLLTATLALLPPPTATDSAAPKGDLRAHLDKAQEISREMLTLAPSTSTTGEALSTVDRTALQRLEVEIDAAERLARRETR